MTNRNRLQPHETYAVIARYGHSGVTLAEALGVNQGTVSRWVTRGGVPLDQLARVCAVLGCRPDELRPECVLVRGLWRAPSSAISAEALGRPANSRIARWAAAADLLRSLGEDLGPVRIDKLCERKPRRRKTPTTTIKEQ